MKRTLRFSLELVSKELNHFGVIAGLFRQIGGHSTVVNLYYMHYILRGTLKSNEFLD